VDIRRVAKTVAGGRRFTFNALVVVGDGQGRVGFGLGKASEVPDAVQKGSAIARRAMVAVPVQESTVPQPGTGVRASAAVRAVVQAAGVRDILTKSQGSNNPINVVQATIKGMQMMRNPQQLIALRRTVRGEPPLAPQEQQQQPQPQAPRATATPVDASQPGEDTGVVTATPASEESATASEAASADETATASEEQTS
jgi:small subunit ribosomal protein S5